MGMNIEIFGSAIILGVELDLMADAEIVYSDDSFDHAFGTEKCGHWEIESISDLRPDCDVRAYVIDCLRADGDTRGNRRFKKLVRQRVRGIEKFIETCDPDDIFTESQKDTACERASERDDLGEEPDGDED